MSTISSFKIRQAVKKVNHGGIIAYPTEAVYGLGCDPLNELAVLNLLKMKQRSVEKGLILIASSIAQLEPYLQLNDQILSRVQATWPGAVTWIIPAQIWVPEWLTGSHSTLAVRVTAHPIVRLLCDEMDGALVSTSANCSNKPAATHSWMVPGKLRDKDLFILAGALGGLKQATPIYDVLDYQRVR